MAWYGSGGWDYYPPYISVGQKKARGMLTLAKLLKKSKRTAEPVVLAEDQPVLARCALRMLFAASLLLPVDGVQ